MLAKCLHFGNANVLLPIAILPLGSRSPPLCQPVPWQAHASTPPKPPVASEEAGSPSMYTVSVHLSLALFCDGWVTTSPLPRTSMNMIDCISHPYTPLDTHPFANTVPCPVVSRHGSACTHTLYTVDTTVVTFITPHHGGPYARVRPRPRRWMWACGPRPTS